MFQVLIRLFAAMVIILQALFKSKNHLILENLALRQQLSNYQIKNKKPKINDIDRSLWIALKKTWSDWKDSLIIVRPETIIDWQRRRFKKYWREKTCHNKKPGRKPILKEIKNLIFRMAKQNDWGAPKIHSELLMLGFTNVSQTTVSRYLRHI